MKSDHHITQPISILIADDHAIFAVALRLLLEKKYSVVGVAANGRALVKEGVRLPPDVIFTDVSMPIVNGPNAARRIKEVDPRVGLVFLTMRDDPHLAGAALEFGNVAFLLKRSEGLKLLGAIEDVLHGLCPFSPKLRPVNRAFSKELTNRQQDIVRLFAEGRRAKEAASILNLNVKTVEFHKYHIMRTFDIKSNAELVLFALERGLIFRRLRVTGK